MWKCNLSLVLTQPGNTHVMWTPEFLQLFLFQQFQNLCGILQAIMGILPWEQGTVANTRGWQWTTSLFLHSPENKVALHVTMIPRVQLQKWTSYGCWMKGGSIFVYSNAFHHSVLQMKAVCYNTDAKKVKPRAATIQAAKHVTCTILKNDLTKSWPVTKDTIISISIRHIYPSYM